MKRAPRHLVPLSEIRCQLLEAFARAGFTVTPTNRLEEALKALQSHQGMLVILDLMGIAEGTHLLEELQATQACEHQQAVFLTVEEQFPFERQLLE
jgi:DNA-binding response OmpR family regulator